MNSIAKNHPVVLQRIASKAVPPDRPIVERVDGVDVLCYSTTRFKVGRRLVEMLPPDGIVLQRIAPKGRASYWVAMTRREFEVAFASTIRASISWEFGYYTSDEVPVAGRAFVIGGI
jgi:hypothetical protein